MSILEAIGARVVYMLALFPVVLLWEKYKYKLNDWLKEKFKHKVLPAKADNIPTARQPMRRVHKPKIGE